MSWNISDQKKINVLSFLFSVRLLHSMCSLLLFMIFCFLLNLPVRTFTLLACALWRHQNHKMKITIICRFKPLDIIIGKILNVWYLENNILAIFSSLFFWGKKKNKNFYSRGIIYWCCNKSEVAQSTSCILKSYLLPWLLNLVRVIDQDVLLKLNS